MRQKEEKRGKGEQAGKKGGRKSEECLLWQRGEKKQLLQFPEIVFPPVLPFLASSPDMKGDNKVASPSLLL